MTARPFAELTGISKAFTPGHLVLDNVSCAFRRGEIHAVLGENGAGKSTLLNILFGMHQPDEGGILIDRRQVIHKTPADAIANCIGMVHQHFKLVTSFTVAENLRLAAPPVIRRTLRTNSDIARIAESFGLPIDPAAAVAGLPLSLQQRVEILKTLINGAELVLFDEPTTILNAAEIDAFYAVVRTIADAGRAVAVVTHHLEEVLDHADRATVIRRGRLISSAAVGRRTRDDLVRDIVGREVDLTAPIARTRLETGPAELDMREVDVAPSQSSSGLRKASLTVHAGEVVGIAGVEGNGQRELFDILSGQRRPDGGSLTARATHGDGRVVAGVVPEDRHQEGLVLDLPISINLLLNRFGEAPYARHGRLIHSEITARAETMRTEADVRTSSISATPRTLSGGNQQKIVLARALNEEAPVVIAHQPTRGLDVAASEDVLVKLRRAADGGKAVVLISSNLEEIMRISDRIVVLFAGQTVGNVAASTPREEIGRLMTMGLSEPVEQAP